MGELIDVIGTIGTGDAENRSKDILGRVYEYFLTQFASAEGMNAVQFDTPRCVVRVLVEMLAPYMGRVDDPCWGSAGMFVQSESSSKRMAGGSATSRSSGRSPTRRREMHARRRERRGANPLAGYAPCSEYAATKSVTP